MDKNNLKEKNTFCKGVILLLFMLISGGSLFADSDSQLQRGYDEVSRQVNRVRGLTLAVLKQIKQLDETCRSGDGSPLPSRMIDASNRMSRIKPLVDVFRSNADEAEALLNKLSSRLDRQSGSTGLTDELKSKLQVLEENLRKYRGHISKYWSRTTRDFGPPPERALPGSGRVDEKVAWINGELTLGTGSSRYKRPNSVSNIDASSTDLSLILTGRYTPGIATSVDAYFSHRKTTLRREIGLTDFGAAVNYQLSSQTTLTAGFDLSKYSDKDNNNADYSQTGFFGRLSTRLSSHDVNVQLRMDSRGYSNLSTADYKTLSFTARDQITVGTGKVKVQLHYLKKTNDIEALDHTETTPSFVYTFSPGGSQFGVSYQQFKMPNATNSPMENNRLKAHLYFGRRSATGSKKWGPEVQMYKYPNRDDADMTDVKLIYQTASRGAKSVLTQWNLVYRRHQDTLQFDFAQVQYRRNSRPMGRGVYSRFNLAARYYVESSDKNNSLRFSNVHPPNTLDIYYRFGWLQSSEGMLNTLSIGPIIAAKAFIDTERSDAFDEDIVDVDFVFRNPANTVRLGFDMAAGIAIEPGITGRAELSYIRTILYNASPVRNTGILKLKIRFSYPVNRDWFVDGYGDLHSTRADIASPNDLDKSQVGVQVRYLFDVHP